MKNILLTPFDFKLMKKHSGVTILVTIFLLFTFTYLLEGAYEYSLFRQKEEFAENGELLSDTALFYNMGTNDITELKSYNFKVSDNKMIGDVEEGVILNFNYEINFDEKDYNLVLIFDIFNTNFYSDAKDIYDLYQIEQENNTIIFVFGTEEVYYQGIDGKNNLINYNYLSFDTNELNTLDDLGKNIARSFTQVYIDYKVSEFTVLSILLVIVFPIILTWIIFKFSGSKVPFEKFKNFFNVMVFSSIVPFIIIAVLTLFVEMAVYFYDVLVFIFFVYNIFKIGNMDN